MLVALRAIMNIRVIQCDSLFNKINQVNTHHVTCDLWYYWCWCRVGELQLVFRPNYMSLYNTFRPGVISYPPLPWVRVIVKVGFKLVFRFMGEMGGFWEMSHPPLP